MITLRTLAITLRWETSEESEKRSDTFKRITCVLGREWVEGAQARKSSQGAIAVVQVNDLAHSWRCSQKSYSGLFWKVRQGMLVDCMRSGRERRAEDDGWQSLELFTVFWLFSFLDT